MDKIWTKLPIEVSEKIISYCGKKSLYREIFGHKIPKSCKKTIENIKILKILNGASIVPCRDLVNEIGEIDVDFCAKLFRESFYLDKFDIVFNVTILCSVFFSKKISTFAQKVSKELNLLKKYIHDNVVCYWLEVEFFDFNLDFENIVEFIKFYVYLELYPHINSVVFEQKFFDRVEIHSFYDFYEFLPSNRHSIEWRITEYFDNIYLHCYDCPKLANLMRKLKFNYSCTFCAKFVSKWRHYVEHVSKYSFLFSMGTSCEPPLEANYFFNDILFDREVAFRLREQLYFIEFGIQPINL